MIEYEAKLPGGGTLWLTKEQFNACDVPGTGRIRVTAKDRDELKALCKRLEGRG